MELLFYVKSICYDNPRFRKAVIRERLEAIKIERQSLLEERQQLDRKIEMTRTPKTRAGDVARTNEASNGASGGGMLRRFCASAAW